MKLYRCKWPDFWPCPCGQTAKALRKAELEFETERVRFGRSRERRPEVWQLSGQGHVPILVLDDSEVVTDSKRIIAKAKTGELG